MISKIIPQSKIHQTEKLIDKFDKMVIVVHRSPDGDAIGSALALYSFLLTLECKATVVVPDSLPNDLLFLDGTDKIVVYNINKEEAIAAVNEAELIFCLDFNALNRLGDMESLITQSKAKKVMIDHHTAPEDFCDVTISHPEISSTSELIFRLICRMDMFEEMTLSSAEAIYTGMMTDTGNFTYSSNKYEMYYIVAELVRKGVDKDKIYAAVFNTSSADKLRLNGYAISKKMKIYPEYKAALITLTLDELNRNNYKRGDIEGLVNVPLAIPDVIFSVLMREDKEYIKISLRSQGKFPTNLIAQTHFNGGGHLNASGGEFYGTLQEAQACYEKILPLYTDYLPSDNK